MGERVGKIARNRFINFDDESLSIHRFFTQISKACVAIKRAFFAQKRSEKPSRHLYVAGTKCWQVFLSASLKLFGLVEETCLIRAMMKLQVHLAILIVLIRLLQ